MESATGSAKGSADIRRRGTSSLWPRKAFDSAVLVIIAICLELASEERRWLRMMTEAVVRGGRSPDRLGAQEHTARLKVRTMV